MNTAISILYVEDDPMSRRVMQMLLEKRMGIEHVTIFEDSHNFLSRAEAIQPVPDVVFLDIHLEPLNGFQMLELLRLSPQFATTPIVAMTASVMNEEIDMLRTAGFDGVIGKPISIASFPALIKQLADGENIWHITDIN